ncbi:transglutaminase domain-containing protein [Agromyces sp. LHK192]|uniref:transglutaminase domain-containing protein n=1 Tax=Agromyces sp. LHK192 TaxID=2498704 RepID=UPI000FD9C95A|nr:transglutaminase domain-containing protein [Agromyces sp. LHK192]
MSGIEAPARRRRAGRAARASRPGEERAVALLGLGYVLAGAALAGWAAWPIHEHWRVWLVVGAGTAIGIGSAWLGSRVAGVLGAIVTGLIATAAYLVLVVPVAIPSALATIDHLVRGLRDGVTGIVLGWRQVLTVEPPLADYQAVLVPLFVTVVAGTTIASALVLRGGRAAPFATIPVIAMTVYGIAFGTAVVAPPLEVVGLVLPFGREALLGIASLTLAAGWLILRSRMRRARAIARVRAGTVVRSGGASAWFAVRRYALAGALLAVALVAGIAVTPAVAAFADRSVLRDEVEPSIVVQRQPSPLGTYRSWFEADRLDETVIEVSGDLEAFERLEFATLDEYTGEIFHVDPDTRYTRLVRSADGAADLAELEVRIGDGYSGVWMPVPDGLAAAPEFEGARTEELADGFHTAASGDAIDIAVDERDADDAPSGPDASDNGLRPGDAYRLVAQRAGGSAGDATAAFASASGGESRLAEDDLPAMAGWIEMQEVPRTGAGLLDLVDRLRTRGYLSHSVLDAEEARPWIAGLQAAGGYTFLPSYAGHSQARIDELFTQLVDQQRRAGEDPPEEMLIAGVGDDEQFAVAAALLARAFGFESRVVLGMRLPGAEPVPGIATCESTCTGASMTAWSEVRAPGGEWVAVDTTPQFVLPPTQITEGEQLPEHPTVPDDERSEPIDPPRANSESSDAAAPPAVSGDDDPTDGLAIVRWVALGTGALLFLLLPVLAVLLLKSGRRRARRSLEDPELRVVAAWEELEDVYVEHGVPFAASSSRAVTAASARRPAAAELARLVDLAVFAPHPPSPETAERAWAIVDAERRDLRAALRPLERWRATFTLRGFTARLRPRTPAAALSLRPKESTP